MISLSCHIVLRQDKCHSKYGDITLASIVLRSCLKRCWTMGIPWQPSQTYSRSSLNRRALLEMLLAQSLETHSKFKGFVCILNLSLSLSAPRPLPPPSLPLSPLPPSNSVSSTLPTGQLSNVPWRRTGVKYTNNEV